MPRRERGRQQPPAVQAAEGVHWCLVTIVLTSAQGRHAVITLGQAEPDGTFTHPGDNVAVFSVAAACRGILTGDR